MKPTNKLRFVAREVPDENWPGNCKWIRVLQQWLNYIEFKEEVQGEWRDVPLEVESE